MRLAILARLHPARAIAIVAVPALLAAPAAGAHPAPATGGPLHRLATVPGGISDVAYAGSVRLYATDGALMRLTGAGRPVRVARLAGEVVQLEASASTVALIEQRDRSRKLLAGPPTGPLRPIAACRGRSSEMPFSPLAVAGPLVAEALTCARGLPTGATAVRIHDGNAVRTLAAEPGRRIMWLAGAPGMLATASVADGRQWPVRLEVRDIASGMQRYAIKSVKAFGIDPAVAVDEHGLAVFCDSPFTLAWASPAEPRVHPLPAYGCPYAGELALARGRIAYSEQRHGRLFVSDLAGHARALMQSAGNLPFAWDGRRLLVRGLGCADDFLAQIGSRARPYRGPGCDVRVLGASRTRDRRAVTVTLACPRGCRGELELDVGNRDAADVSFHARRPGRARVRAPLSRRARRELARYRSVPWHVIAFYVNPREGGSSSPSTEASGTLPGDGSKPFPPPPPPPPET